MLLLEFDQGATPRFLVRQATIEPLEMSDGFLMSLTGGTIDQLPLPLHSAELIGPLQHAVQHGLTQFRFQHVLAGSLQRYACQLMRIDDRQLVLSLEGLNEPSPEVVPDLEQVVEIMPTGLIVFRAIRDTEHTIVDFQATLCNQLGATITNQSREDILTRPISQRYNNMREHAFFQQYVDVVTTGKPRQQLLHLPSRDVWIDVSVVKYQDGMLVSFQDVTVGQKTASLLESVMSSSPAAVRYYETIRDSTGQIVDFMTSTGNELEAFRPFRPYASTTGRRLLELYPYLKTNGLFERYVAVVESGHSDRFEICYQQDSRTAWLDCTAVRHGNGLVLTTLDITPFKLTQLDLQRQTELITGVLNASASSILVLDPLYGEAGQINDFRVSLANPATLRLFAPFVGREFTQDDFLTSTLLTLFPASRQRDVFTALSQVVSTGKPIYHSADYPQLNVAYDYAITPFQKGVLMITTDITPLRSYQQKLEANNAALIRSNEYLQQFAYVASHDLQEPLRKIHSFGDMLLSQHAETLSPTGRDLLQRMQNAAIRMQTLVKEMLNYSRLTNHQTPLLPVSLQALTQDVLGDLETIIQETNATVTIGQLPIIPGDKTQLRQLLQNLLANALKFSKPNQPPQVYLDAIILTAEQLPPSASTTVSSQWVSLTVADNGIGFDEVHQERIFELFRRLHGRNQYTGTGIGLAVVKKVVENHYGFINVHSQPGEGATFTVYLPMAQPISN